MGYIDELRAIVGHRPLILNGVKVLIVDKDGCLLLQKRIDGVWDVPGGLMELGESLEDTGRREILEETGLQVKELKLFGVFSGLKYFVELANGDQFYAVTTVFITKDYQGEPRPDYIEGTELRFFCLSKLPKKINPKMSDIIEKYFKSDRNS